MHDKAVARATRPLKYICASSKYKYKAALKTICSSARCCLACVYCILCVKWRNSSRALLLRLRKQEFTHFFVRHFLEVVSFGGLVAQGIPSQNQLTLKCGFKIKLGQKKGSEWLWLWAATEKIGTPQFHRAAWGRGG